MMPQPFDNVLEPTVVDIIVRASSCVEGQVNGAVTSERILIALLEEEVAELLPLFRKLGITVKSVNREFFSAVETYPVSPDLPNELERSRSNHVSGDLEFITLHNRSIALAPIALTVLKNAIMLADQRGRVNVSSGDILRSLLHTSDCTACKLIENHGLSASELLKEL